MERREDASARLSVPLRLCVRRPLRGQTPSPDVEERAHLAAAARSAGSGAAKCIASPVRGRVKRSWPGVREYSRQSTITVGP